MSIINKIFNTTEIEETLLNLKEKYNFNLITDLDIYNKKCFQKIKDLKKIENANILFLYLKYNKPEEVIPMAEKFFHIKIGEIKESGREFSVEDFFYSKEDKKIYCVVNDSGNIRTFKLLTDLYEKRTKEYIPELISFFKKIFDKFYGFFIIKENDTLFITDMNKSSNGSYKKIATIESNGTINTYLSSFGKINNFFLKAY